MSTTETMPEEPKARHSAAPPADEESNPREAIDDQQTRRLEEYVQIALRTSDPLQATLNCQAAQNLVFAQRLQRETLDFADEMGGLIEVLAEHPHVTTAILQIQRQAERYLRLSAETQRRREAIVKQLGPLAL